MKRDGHQQSGIARICNCKCPWTSSSSSSSSSPAYPARTGTTDDQWPQPPSAAGNSRTACARCHRPRPGGGGGAHHRRSAPGPKSMGKVKGARKVRSCDVALNHRLVSWRVVDRGADGMARAGVSASGIAGYLEGYRHEEYDDEYDEDMEEAGAAGASDWCGAEVEMGCEIGEVAGGGVDEEEPMATGMEDDAGGGVGTIGDTDDMGFCEVGFVWDYVDEEDWCVVGEL